MSQHVENLCLINVSCCNIYSLSYTYTVSLLTQVFWHVCSKNRTLVGWCICSLIIRYKKVELLFTNMSLSGRTLLSELCQDLPMMWCSQLGEAASLSEEACKNRSLLSDAAVFMPRLSPDKQTNHRQLQRLHLASSH